MTAVINPIPSDTVIDHTAPLSPKARVMGIPTARQKRLEAHAAAKTDAGDSIARNTIAGPKKALQQIDPSATTPTRSVTSMYLPE
jgi:hypothetical protein